MDLFVVTYSKWDESYPVSVCSSLKKAEKLIAKKYGGSTRYSVQLFSMDKELNELSSSRN